MNKITFTLILSMMLTIGILADSDIYGADGSYKGEIEKDGSIYSADGSYKGEVEKDGSIYGTDGSYKGEIY